MKQEIEIKVESHGVVTVFDIQGDVTVFSEPFLNEAYEKANNEGAKKLLLKFEESAYINSGGIAVLIQLLAKTNKNDQQIGVTGLSKHFKKIFHMVGITKFAEIHNSMEEALSSLSQS